MFAKNCQFKFYADCCLILLTVVLTNVRQPCGPKCLVNVSYCVYDIVTVIKSDSSRPDVAAMLPTI